MRSKLVVDTMTTASFETALSSISFNRQDVERELAPSHSFIVSAMACLVMVARVKDAPLGEYLSSSCIHITTKILESSSTVLHVDLCVVQYGTVHMYRTAFFLSLPAWHMLRSIELFSIDIAIFPPLSN